MSLQYAGSGVGAGAGSGAGAGAGDGLDNLTKSLPPSQTPPTIQR